MLFEDVTFVELIYLVVTRMQGDRYRRRLVEARVGVSLVTYETSIDRC